MNIFLCEYSIVPNEFIVKKTDWINYKTNYDMDKNFRFFYHFNSQNSPYMIQFNV